MSVNVAKVCFLLIGLTISKRNRYILPKVGIQIAGKFQDMNYLKKADSFESAFLN
jgi:hypothetical protein